MANFWAGMNTHKIERSNKRVARPHCKWICIKLTPPPTFFLQQFWLRIGNNHPAYFGCFGFSGFFRVFRVFLAIQSDTSEQDCYQRIKTNKRDRFVAESDFWPKEKKKKKKKGKASPFNSALSASTIPQLSFSQGFSVVKRRRTLMPYCWTKKNKDRFTSKE